MNLSDLKLLVERSAIASLRECFRQFLTGEMEAEEGWDYIFQKVYLHACLKGKKEIANWMETEVFSQLPVIQQVAIRQVFAYGHILLKKIKE